MTVCTVIGLGKLGSSFALSLAASGQTVIGADWDEYLVKTLNSGRAPSFEPGFYQLLNEAGDRFRATTDTKAAVEMSEATFILVPTPSQTDGSFSLDNVMVALRPIIEALREKEDWHLVTVVSTVMPGHTDGPIREALEQGTGRRIGENLGLCYSPEFIALGSVIHDIAYPDFTLIGESDSSSGQVLESLIKGMVKNSAPVAHLSLAEAELAKLAINTYVTTKISYANFLSELCDHIVGADARRVTAAIGLDRRIGPHYLKPATAYGGPCFPRDNLAMSAFAQAVGVEADIPLATDAVNRRQVERLANIVDSLALHDPAITILGLAYKAGTPVTEAAAGVQLARALVTRGKRVTMFDPQVTQYLLVVPRASFASSLAEAVSSADVIFIMTDDPAFKSLGATLAAIPEMPLVVDCWGIVEQPASQQYMVLRPGQWYNP